LQVAEKKEQKQGRENVVRISVTGVDLVEIVAEREEAEEVEVTGEAAEARAVATVVAEAEGDKE
jgi:hypothetical protein